MLTDNVLAVGQNKERTKLTLSAHRAEPPLGPSLPPVDSLSLIGLSSSGGARAFLLRCKGLCGPSIGLVIVPGRNGLRFRVSDGTSSAKFDHVDRTLAARD